MEIFETSINEINNKRLKDCCEDVIAFDKVTDKIAVNIYNLSLHELNVVLGTAKALETSVIQRLFQEAKKKESKED